MALKLMKTISDKLLFGTCMPFIHESAIKVQVPTLELDSYILMYLKKESIFYALDPNKRCKVGDMVIIRKLPTPFSKLVTHEVIDIAYTYGDITDPVTGEKCVMTKSRALIEKEAELFGKTENRFDYSAAPKRGWQEGKKDFTDKEVYVKYHEFKEDEEESKDPYTI